MHDGRSNVGGCTVDLTFGDVSRVPVYIIIKQCKTTALS